MKYRDRAVVLSRRNVNGYDWSVTLLTCNFGVRTVLLKNAQQPTHRLRKRLTVGAHVDVEFYRGAVITHVQPFEGLSRNPYLPAMMAAVEHVANIERFPDLYYLTVTALRMKTDPKLVVVSFLLRLMDLTGWGPTLGDCATCGTAGPHRAFNTAAGGSVCDRCTPAGSTIVHAGVVELMRVLAGKSSYQDGVHGDAGAAVALTVAIFERQLECLLPQIRL